MNTRRIRRFLHLAERALGIVEGSRHRRHHHGHRRRRRRSGGEEVLRQILRRIR